MAYHAYDWNFRLFLPYAGAFLRGVAVTINLSVLSTVIGTGLGFGLGALMRLPYVGEALGLVNDVFRAVPVLVFMLFFYYIPYQQLFNISSPGPFTAALAALTLAQMNFTADVARSAMDGVSQRLILAGRAVGLREPTIWWYIILPDVIRQIAPTLVAFFIGTVKLSSLASVIGVEDVVYVARLAVSQTFRSLEAWVVVAAIYVALVVPITIAARRLERSSWLKRRS